VTEKEWPPVWLLFATFKRTTAALQTIDSLREHLFYPNLHWHICDDGSGKTDDGTDRWHVGVLTDYIAEFYPEVTWHEMETPPGRFNTGGNINRGIQIAKENGSDIHMLNFDDWARFEPLDLCPMVDILDTHPQVGFVRLSYWVPGLSGYSLRLDSPRTSGCHIWFRLIRKWCLENPWERQAYLVSTQPYVAHTRFFDYYGYHPENCNPGEAEVGMGHLYNKVPHENGPQILFPIGPCSVHSGWGHIAPRANDYLAAAGPA